MARTNANDLGLLGDLYRARLDDARLAIISLSERAKGGDNAAMARLGDVAYCYSSRARSLDAAVELLAAQDAVRRARSAYICGARAAQGAAERLRACGITVAPVTPLDGTDDRALLTKAAHQFNGLAVEARAAMRAARRHQPATGGAHDE